MGVDTVVTCEVVYSVQTSFVLVKSLQSNLITQDGEELVQVVAVLVIVQYLLLRVLPLLHIDHSNLQLRLHEHLTSNDSQLIFDNCYSINLAWSSFSSSSLVSGSWPSVNGGLRFISLPRDPTTSSLLYLQRRYKQTD